MLFLNIYTGLGNFIRTTHISLILKVWVHLIDERQQETPRNKPITRAMSASSKLQLLESHSIT